MLELWFVVYLACVFLAYVGRLIDEGQSWTEWDWFRTPRERE